MAVFLSNKKALESAELKGIVDVEKLWGNDILQNMEGATASIGRYKFGAGFVLPDWTFTYDEFQYILKGSEKIETEGKTIVAREGDIVHVQKGTVGTLSSDEGCELVLIIMPDLKTLGFMFED
jgi:ethanolamine utilization protein EutQ (cupin superfamily)